MNLWLSDLESDNDVLEFHVERISELIGEPIKFKVDTTPLGEKVVSIMSAEGTLTVYRCNLAVFPGCCGVLISHSSYSFSHRRKGVHSYMSTVKQELAAWLGYSALICTDIADNRKTNTVLCRDGWAPVFKFNNQTRTRNDVNIYAVDVTQYESGGDNYDDENYYDDDDCGEEVEDVN